MADDPYEVLGVPRSATDDQIRKAYLKLVKELHPDVNPSKAAEERFKKVTAAHDILGDPERRRQFDMGEIDASGEPRRPTWRTYGAGAGAGAGARGRGGPIFEDFGDMFSDIFSGRGGTRGGGFAMRGRDVRYTLDVDFVEAVQGAKKRVTLPDKGVLDLTVPAGVADGQVLRLRGRGEAGVAGGEPGDALVEIGPGEGALTWPLLRAAGGMTVIEFDGARRQGGGADGRRPGAAHDPEGHELRTGAAAQGQGRAQRHDGRHGRRAGDGQDRAAGDHRRQPVLLPVGVAPEAPLRSAEIDVAPVIPALRGAVMPEARRRRDRAATLAVMGWFWRLSACRQEWPGPRPWRASGPARRASAAARPRRKAGGASP